MIRFRFSLMMLAIVAPVDGGDKPYFRALGTLPQGPGNSLVCDTNADGNVAVGRGFIGIFAGFPVRWVDGQIEALAPANGLLTGNARAVSGNGDVIVGSGRFDNGTGGAFRWSVDEGITAIPDLPGGDQGGGAIGVSRDGSVIVGIGLTENSPEGGGEAFRWTRETGTVGLGDLPGGVFSSVATDVSADGRVVVGSGWSVEGNEAFHWTAETGMVGIGDLPGGTFRSVASVVSADGRVIAGNSDGLDDRTGGEGFRWTAETGMIPLVDPNSPHYQHIVCTMTPDGSILVGSFASHNPDLAFIWDAVNGSRDLAAILRDELGVLPDGWVLQRASGISADGRTIVGDGINPATGGTEAWIAYLGPPPCPSDIDGDGSVGLSDLGILLRWFGTSVIGTHDRGDVNFDGDIDLQDLGLMLSAFGTNCP